jgi:hypothetical protein
MQDDRPSFAPALIKLLQGVVYHDDASAWSLIRDHEPAVRAHFQTIGLDLHLSEADGYAFLRQTGPEVDEEPLPRLVRRIPLNYMTTLLCVLLRERLLQHDTGDIDSPRLVVHRDDLVEAMLHFVKQRSDETRVVRQIDAAINRAADMGFLSALKTEEDAYEVRRVLKAHLTADKLAEIKASMETHAEENAG